MGSKAADYNIQQEETIAAISTPMGEGGIGVVRLSGKTAIDILARMFQNPAGGARGDFESRRVYYGFIVEADGAKIDEVLVTVMRGPATYTREDVVEISCHGGSAILKKALRRALDLGARMAQPGEFSKRAFLNGRIDLVQAEAVIDLIRSKSERAWKTAFSQLDGKLSRKLNRIEDDLVNVLSQIEASIDFPDEELEIAANETLVENLESIKAKIAEMVSSYTMGRIFREGVAVVIVGRPNVGKSSLMNALLEKDRVIVTPIPGTTRDTIEESLEISGFAVRIIDTAGVRQTSDPAEIIGAERAMEAAHEADVVLALIDASVPLTAEDEELLDRLAGLKAATGAYLIAVVNKSDLPLRADLAKLASLAGAEVIHVSAKTGDGLNNVRRGIIRGIDALGEALSESAPITRERHREKLMEMGKSIDGAMEALRAGLGREYVAADLRDAKEAMEELTGKALDADVLNRIFNEFCIGK